MNNDRVWTNDRYRKPIYAKRRDCILLRANVRLYCDGTWAGVESAAVYALRNLEVEGFEPVTYSCLKRKGGTDPCDWVLRTNRREICFDIKYNRSTWDDGRSDFAVWTSGQQYSKIKRTNGFYIIVKNKGNNRYDIYQWNPRLRDSLI
jgi:hypothetical protein